MPVSTNDQIERGIAPPARLQEAVDSLLLQGRRLRVRAAARTDVVGDVDQAVAQTQAKLLPRVVAVRVLLRPEALGDHLLVHRALADVRFRPPDVPIVRGLGDARGQRLLGDAELVLDVVAHLRHAAVVYTVQRIPDVDDGIRLSARGLRHEVVPRLLPPHGHRALEAAGDVDATAVQPDPLRRAQAHLAAAMGVGDEHDVRDF